MASKNKFQETLDCTPPVEVPSPQVDDADKNPKKADAKPDEKEPRKKQKDMLMECIKGVIFWHDKLKRAYARFKVNGHFENHRLESREFKQFVGYLYYKRFGGAPSAQAVAEALGALSALALYEGRAHQPQVRLAKYGSVLYVDLGTQDWQVARIDASGFRIIDSKDVPVMFIRRPGMLPLSLPIKPALGVTYTQALEPIFDLVNCDEDGRILLTAWILGAYNPDGPYPILAIVAEQGSGKSVTTRGIRSLVDPNEAPTRNLPEDDRELAVSASNSWVMGYDNLSGISKRISDSLCKLATGFGFSTREMYTDMDEIIIYLTRPVIVNGIDDLTTRGDFIERAEFLKLPPIPDAERKPEADLWQAFEAARPQIMWAIFSLLSIILRERPNVQATKLPRMADFACWIMAAEDALGWPKGSFLDTFNKNKLDATRDVLESSLVAQALHEQLSPGHAWEMTASEILKLLSVSSFKPDRDSPMWPRTASYLSRDLRRLAPDLRKVGFSIEIFKVKHERKIRIKRERT